MVYIGPKERRELAAKNKPVLFPNHPEWRKCAERFLIKIRGRCDSDDSRRVYEIYLRMFFCDPNKTPDDYTQADILDFINAPTNGPNSRGKPPKPGTRNGRLAKIRSFYRFASRYRVPAPTPRNPRRTRILLQADDPTEDIELAETQSAKKTMSDDEVERFFAAIDTSTVQGMRDKCLFLFYFWLGRRKTSVLSLRWGDLEKTTFIEDGKKRQGWIYHFREKGAKVGFAELPPPLPEMLDTYLTMSGRKGSMNKESPLFVGTVNCDTSKPLDGRTADYLFRRYAKLAGIDKKHSIHSWRHTAAARRWEEEVASGRPDLLRLMQFLGHSDPKTTMAYLDGIVHVSDTVAQRLYKRYGNL